LLQVVIDRFFYKCFENSPVNRSVCAQRLAIFLVSAEQKHLTPAYLSIMFTHV
jgi:hypothetical protein